MLVTLDRLRLRISILWIAMCFDTAEDLELVQQHEDVLTIERAPEIFADDLRRRGEHIALPEGERSRVGADPGADLPASYLLGR